MIDKLLKTLYSIFVVRIGGYDSVDINIADYDKNPKHCRCLGFGFLSDGGI